MAYTPKTWQTGDLIDAAQLNNIDAALRRASSSLQARNLGTQTIGTPSQFVINLTATSYTSGDGFTLGSDNEITCKYDGIVVVGAKVYCVDGFTAGDQIALSVSKNGNNLDTTFHRLQSTGGEHVVSKPCLVDVKAGDVLKMHGQNMGGARGTIGSTGNAFANCLTVHYLA